MSSAKFTEEFREEAVRLVIEGGRSANSVSKEIGVSQSTLSAWVRQFKSFGNPSQSRSEQEQEISRLKKELKRVQMERDFLSDAAAYFAKHKKGGSLQ